MSSNPPAEAERRWWPGDWSLRARLLTGQVLLLVVVCVGVGLGTEWALRGYLTHQLDGQVAEVTARSALLAGLPPPPVRTGVGAGRRSGPGPAFLDAPGQSAGVIAAVVDRRPGRPGEVDAGLLGAGGERVGLTAAAQARIGAIEPKAAPVTVDLDQLGSYRLAADYDRFGRIVVAGLPTADLDATLRRVRWTFLLFSAAAALLAGILGALITGRALAPLTRMAATARRVAGLPLDRGEVELPVRVPERVAAANTEVGQMGSALNRMLDHIAAALSARQASETRVRRFVADASHELRTPLAAIRGYTELAQRHADDLPPEIAHALGRVSSESDRMTHLVEDLLLLARLDSGRPLEGEPVDLSRLAVDAVADAHIAGPDHNWKLELPAEPVLVTGDALRLQQVLVNLLANARTHTPAGTTVTLGLAQEPGGAVGAGSTPGGTTPPTEPGAVLRVCDDGPGIPAELQPEVFTRFTRGDSSRSRRDGGTGLGLAIVAAIVRAHHGSIEVDSAPGSTVFTVRLPFTADT